MIHHMAQISQRISIEEYKKAKNERLKFKIRRKRTFKAGYFTDWVRQRVINIIGETEQASIQAFKSTIFKPEYEEGEERIE